MIGPSEDININLSGEYDIPLIADRVFPCTHRTLHLAFDDSYSELKHQNWTWAQIDGFTKICATEI